MYFDMALTSPGVYFAEGIWMNSRSHPSSSFGCDLFLQIGEARVYGGRGLDEFSRHVFHSLDTFASMPGMSAGSRQNLCWCATSIQMRCLRRCGSLSICTDACQETEKESEKCDRFHFRIPFAQRTRRARPRPAFCHGRRHAVMTCCSGDVDTGGDRRIHRGLCRADGTRKRNCSRHAHELGADALAQGQG